MCNNNIEQVEYLEMLETKFSMAEIIEADKDFQTQKEFLNFPDFLYNKYRKILYKIVLDIGKPQEFIVNSETELKAKIKEIYNTYDNIDTPYLDLFVYNDKDEDITEQQFIQDIIMNIMGC